MGGEVLGEELEMAEPSSPASTGLKQGAATPLVVNRAQGFILQTTQSQLLPNW